MDLGRMQVGLKQQNGFVSFTASEESDLII